MQPTRADEVEMLGDALRAILFYEPKEIAYDEFAYKRMVESYRQAARFALDKQEKMREARRKKE